MKCIIEFELPDNDTVLKDIKVEPVHWTYHGYSGYCKAKQKAERKKGKWKNYIEDGYLECPFCGAATNCDGDIEELHFCFSCGARLEE